MLLRIHAEQATSPDITLATKFLKSMRAIREQLRSGGEHMVPRDATDMVRMTGAGVILAVGAILAIVRIVQTIGWSLQLGAMAAMTLVVGVVSVLVGSRPPDQMADEAAEGPASSGWAPNAIQGPEDQRDEHVQRFSLSPRDAGQMTTLGNLVRQGAQPLPHHVERANEIVGRMATATSSVQDAALRRELLTHAAELTQVLVTLSDTEVPELSADVQVKAAESFSGAAGAIRRAVPTRELPEQHHQSVS
jgi:hypothetical protein